MEHSICVIRKFGLLSSSVRKHFYFMLFKSVGDFFYQHFRRTFLHQQAQESKVYVKMQTFLVSLRLHSNGVSQS